MTFIAAIYGVAFLLCTTMLVGDRGFTRDLRTRSRAIAGGRRQFDPAFAARGNAA